MMSGPTDKTDIVDRLRGRIQGKQLGDDPLAKVLGEAADEIERLRALSPSAAPDAMRANDSGDSVAQQVKGFAQGRAALSPSRR